MTSVAFSFDMTVEVIVPDIGEFDEVDVVEVLVEAGQHVEADDSLITLESDKASMDVPAPVAGVVGEVALAVGDKVGEGALIVRLEPDESAADVESRVEEPERRTAPAATVPRGGRLVVIGSGPGGYTAAFRAADLGMEVTLVERYPVLGGVCLNVGCIPSKALLHVAEVLEEVSRLGDRGVRVGTPKIDVTELGSWKDGVVGKLTKGVRQMAKARGVQVVGGTASFASPNRIAVDGAEAREIEFASAIVAVGSRATALPGAPEDPRIWDSTRALELGQVPKRLLVVGGGIIGLEMATVFDALGSHVTVVELLDRLITGCDADLVRRLQRRIQRRYQAIHLSCRVEELKPLKSGIKVSFAGEKAPDAAIFDCVLVATGRRPNGDRVGAEAAGVKVDDRGFIPVDSQQRTNVSHIFAIGDVSGEPMLAHRASHQGKVAAEAVVGLDSYFDASVIPSVAYTDPELAWVGLSEEEAGQRGIEVATGVFPWSASGRSLALDRNEGMTKLVFDPATRRLLGAGIVGPRAGDLIAEATLAIEMGADAEDLALTVHAHPTLSETVAFAAEAFAGTVTDIYLPKSR